NNVDIVPRAPRHDRTAEYCLDGKKVTTTYRQRALVGCRCVPVLRSKRSKLKNSALTENRRTPSSPRGRGRMSLSSFRVHPNATGQQSIASTEKSDEHHRRHGCGKDVWR
ncbi:hypothetical protein TNCV_879711, partial [Trichonephila clavipes]